ncbi:MAG TPA: hypothetical protein VK556_03405 [Candidatus Udaeobacter sp.]|nr:hypothetical protein [Candidatus Udaeobacter sp.]
MDETLVKDYHAKEPDSVVTVKFELESRSTKTPIDALSRSPEFVRMTDLNQTEEISPLGSCTRRYEAVNAMLLNEFVKEHRKVEQLTKDFESKLAEQKKQIEALTAGLQKVSAQ